MLKLNLWPILWPPDANSLEKDPDAGKDWRQKEKRAPEDEMAEHAMDMNLGKLQEMRQGGLAWCSHEVTKSQTQLATKQQLKITTQHNSMNVLMLLNRTLKKWLRWQILCYVYFYHNLKNKHIKIYNTGASAKIQYLSILPNLLDKHDFCGSNFQGIFIRNWGQL